MTPALSTSRTVAFGRLDISFDDRLLEPRPWTLAQSDWAADLATALPAGDVAELCCGAGHIGLHAILGSERRLVCVDDNPVAFDHAWRNARAAGLADQVEVRCGRIDEVWSPDERFVLVIADPPWVPRASVGRFPEDPVHAIDGGVDGLALVGTCLAVAGERLLDGGVLLLQVGPGQEEWVARESGRHGLRVVETRAFGERGALVRLDRVDRLGGDA